MSIDTFKETFGIEPNNTDSNNSDSKIIYNRYESEPSIPDEGDFDKVWVYRVSDLESYYNI